MGYGARNLDAHGIQLRGLPHRGKGDADALHQAADDGLGDPARILNRRRHATEQDVVPRVVVKRRDAQTRGQRGTQTRNRLYEAQEHQAVHRYEADLAPFGPRQPSPSAPWPMYSMRLTPTS